MLDHFKGALKSWTIHFNLYMAALIEGLPLAKDGFPDLAPYLPDDIFKTGMMLLVVGNLLLRFKTKTCLSVK
jgi:hypothetical protein